MYRRTKNLAMFVYFDPVTVAKRLQYGENGKVKFVSHFYHKIQCIEILIAKSNAFVHFYHKTQ